MSSNVLMRPRRSKQYYHCIFTFLSFEKVIKGVIPEVEIVSSLVPTPFGGFSAARTSPSSMERKATGTGLPLCVASCTSKSESYWISKVDEKSIIDKMKKASNKTDIRRQEPRCETILQRITSLESAPFWRITIIYKVKLEPKSHRAIAER